MVQMPGTVGCMRRREYEAEPSVAVELFERAEAMQVAGTDEAGEVVLKTVHGVVDEGWVCFHAAPAGEKTSLLGRQVVASVEQVVSRLPSTFFDAERACPATTLFRSAQVRGVLTAIEGPERKARVLQRLMEKLQPQGGYRPITATERLYGPSVKGLLIAGVPLTGATAKAKLAQNKSAEVRGRLLEHLWQRGEPGDPRTIELVRAANPDTPTPGFLTGPAGLRLHVAMDERLLDACAALLAAEYWNDRFSLETLRKAHQGSAAWVGATTEAGSLVGTARAMSDGAKYAWVYDVCVEPSWRGRGVGQALMRLLLEHPAVRGCALVRLGTRDAQSLYRRFGFVDTATVPRPYRTTEMVLVRAAGRTGLARAEPSPT